MLKPAGYRLLLEMEEVAEKTAGGIILAQQTKDADEAANQFGKVVAIGEFAFKEYADGKGAWCKVGDTVTITKYAGKVEIDRATGKKYRVVNDIDIHCIETPSRVKCSECVDECPSNAICTVINP